MRPGITGRQRAWGRGILQPLMPGSSSRRRFSAPTQMALVALAVTLAASLVALGGAARWSLYVVLPGACLALALASSGARREGTALRLTPFGGVLLAAAVLTSLQLIPLPPSVQGVLSPHAASWRADTLVPLGLDRWRPLTTDAPSTARFLSLQVALFAAFLAAVHVARGREGRRRLLTVLGGTGALVAGVAILHLLLRAESLFGLYRFTEAAPPLPSFFGNPNHLASLLTLTALCAAGLALSARERPVALLWGLGFVLQGAAVALSLSRGGIVFFVVACGLYALWSWGLPAAGRVGGGRARAAQVAAGLVAVASVGAYVAWERLWGEWGTVDSLEKLGQSKASLWPMLARAASEHPWAGVGRGAFELGFMRHQTQWPDVVFTHAENLPLHLGLELGLLPAGALVCGAGFALWRCLRGRAFDTLELAALAGIAGLVLHDLFDFALELAAPALAVTLSLAVLSSRRSPSSDSRRPRTRLAHGLAPALLLVGGLSLHAGRHHHQDAEAGLAARLQAQVPAPQLLEAARPLLDRHPHDPLLFGLLAQAFSAGPGSSPQNALAFANRALRLRPLDAEAHLAAARALAKLGRRSQAMLEYRLAAQAGAPGALEEIAAQAREDEELWTAVPREPGPVVALAHGLNGRGRRAQARALLERARGELEPSSAATPLWVLAASWRLEDADAQGAQALAERALELDPGNAAAHRVRAEALAREGHRDRAIAALREALRTEVGNLELSLALVGHLVAEGDRQGAREVLQRASPFVSSIADRVRLLQAEAHLHAQQGRRAKALEALKTASRLQPENAALHYERARLYEKVGRPHQALEAVREGVRAEGTTRPDIEAWMTALQTRASGLLEVVDAPEPE